MNDFFMTQRDKMRELFTRHAGDQKSVIEAYAEAERRGEVYRTRNNRGVGSLEYAALLLADGLSKGWLAKSSMKAEANPTLEAPKFIIPLRRFDDDIYIEQRVSAAPQSIRGSLRTTLSYLYLTENGPFNLPKDRIDSAWDFLEQAEQITASWLYTRTNGNLRSQYGREALLAARGARYRCEHCGYPDVRTLNLDHVHGRNEISSFACLCANCHTIKSREHDWTGRTRSDLKEQP